MQALLALSMFLMPVAGSEMLVNLFVPEGQRASAKSAALKLDSLALSREEYEWVHVLSEGWATPLKGFMTETQMLQSLHYQHLIMPDGSFNPMPVPIAKTCSKEEKERLTGKDKIALTWNGQPIAVMSKPAFFEHQKEERAGRTFGITHKDLPYIDMIYNSGDWLVGGDIEVFADFKYNDGMDQWRLSPTQLKAKFTEIGADAVFVFQLRNPVHNGHALLMQDTAKRLKEKGFKKPVLWLSPLGGWTKDDDVPLKTRMDQHHAIIKNGIFGDTEVVLAIFPSPMLYAGPREVQWHAKARLNAGATHYIVGRDPAGMKHPGTNEDLYHMWHGQDMLKMNNNLKAMAGHDDWLLPFHFASYDTKANKMAFFDPKRKADFKSISGSKMRQLARDGETPPVGFMDPEGWDILTKFYQGQKQEL